MVQSQKIDLHVCVGLGKEGVATCLHAPAQGVGLSRGGKRLHACLTSASWLSNFIGKPTPDLAAAAFTAAASRLEAYAAIASSLRVTSCGAASTTALHVLQGRTRVCGGHHRSHILQPRLLCMRLRMRARIPGYVCCQCHTQTCAHRPGSWARALQAWFLGVCGKPCICL